MARAISLHINAIREDEINCFLQVKMQGKWSLDQSAFPNETPMCCNTFEAKKTSVAICESRSAL